MLRRRECVVITKIEMILISIKDGSVSRDFFMVHETTTIMLYIIIKAAQVLHCSTAMSKK